jgi:hypothetical protein
VQFYTQASDGVVTGMSRADRQPAAETRRSPSVTRGCTTLSLSSVTKFRSGERIARLATEIEIRKIAPSTRREDDHAHDAPANEHAWVRTPPWSSAVPLVSRRQLDNIFWHTMSTAS